MHKFQINFGLLAENWHNRIKFPNRFWKMTNITGSCCPKYTTQSLEVNLEMKYKFILFFGASDSYESENSKTFITINFFDYCET